MWETRNKVSIATKQAFNNLYEEAIINGANIFYTVEMVDRKIEKGEVLFKSEIVSQPFAFSDEYLEACGFSTRMVRHELINGVWETNVVYDVLNKDCAILLCRLDEHQLAKYKNIAEETNRQIPNMPKISDITIECTRNFGFKHLTTMKV